MKTMMTMVACVMAMTSAACVARVEPGPTKTETSAPAPCPDVQLPVSDTVQFDLESTFEGSQGILVTECPKFGAGAIVGGWCELSGGGTLFADQEYYGDGWTCVANIGPKERVTIKLHMVCLSK